MKVILLRDVARLGRKGEVKEVPAGHAQNLLIPQGMAERATPATLARLEAQRETIEAERAEAHKRLAALRESLAQNPVVIEAQANELGHLFKGLHANDIAEAISARAGETIGPEVVMLPQPIKEVGTYEVTIGDGDDEGVVTIEVKAA